ncbi:MAG: efflux transporter outer membrane subunit [Desulfosarcinaceae bacterium]|nr:efflux transporter outer membrane subunit [Desulfosarcinaceae bacterium]
MKQTACVPLQTRLQRKLATFSFAVALLMMVGCAAVGPDFVPPDTDLPDGWQTALRDGLRAESLDPDLLARWWLTLEDPLLTRLIEQAIADSPNLRAAAARLREARARRGISGADRFPTVNAAAAATKNRSSENTGIGGESELYSAGFDASWELDIFGGVRRSVEAADADVAASREDLRDVLVSLTAEVALNYIEVRSFQTRLDIANANRDAQAETYRLVQNRFGAGLAAQLEVEQSRYNLESTRSEIPSLNTGVEQALNRLAVILGQPPGTLNNFLSERRPVPVTPMELAVGIPAQTLRRRPDVRRAEWELAAQTARIGVATAELYPKFNLLGSIGLESLASSDLLTAASRTYSIGPSVSWRIFEAGRVRRQIDVETARQEQALIHYETAVLTALEDVENALVAYADEQDRRRSLSQAADAAERAVELARNRYRAGLSDFQNVLDAQRSLLSFQDQLAISDATVTSNLIRLYKALGGGWSPIAASSPDAPTAP